MNPAFASIALWYRLLLIVVSVAGFVTGSHSTAFLTTITNSIVLGYLVIAVWTMVARRTAEAPAGRLRLAVTTWIVFVGIIAHIFLAHWASPFPALADPDPKDALEGWTILIIHYAMPVGMLVDWLAFGPRGRPRWIDLVWIGAYPLAYGLITILRAILFPMVDDRIPYPFLEPSGPLGWGGVILYLLPMLGAAILIGAILLGYDRLALRLGRRRSGGAPGALRAERRRGRGRPRR